jgi:hypothetical protein
VWVDAMMEDSIFDNEPKQVAATHESEIGTELMSRDVF